ncbi:MAG: hypothetical protein CMC35_09565 [Flavobacteriaceae bacterium]|nr:hypothetical protein [Flavobacteriaceae bacterium]|tara:strand:+ start:185 stop:460 length:276 start_codon:yes stop_codon:yes gene_type:complete
MTLQKNLAIKKARFLTWFYILVNFGFFLGPLGLAISIPLRLPLNYEILLMSILLLFFGLFYLLVTLDMYREYRNLSEEELLIRYKQQVTMP